jgi:hypothetical protein
MPLTRAQTALARRAGNTVVAAATTYAWEPARVAFSRLLGRGDPDRTRAMERRLEETRRRLTAPPDVYPDWRQAALEEVRWETRLEDLLEDDPGVAADLEALVRQIQERIRREGPLSQPFSRRSLREDREALERLEQREALERLEQEAPRRHQRVPAAPAPASEPRPRTPRPSSPAPAQGLGGDQSGD